MKDDLAWSDAGSQAAAIRTGKISPLELVSRAIARLEVADQKLNVLASDRFERALEEARSDTLPPGPFRGVPIVLKDVGCAMAGESNYMGNALLKRLNVRAEYDSALTRRLRTAGFIVLGRTTAPEFAIRSTTESVAHGATLNPWSLKHSTGGSSGGSAASVAAGLVAIGQGSDGAGSLRMPASLCGVVTMKPTRGRISQAPDGAQMMGHSEYGAITRTIGDLAAFMKVASGNEPGDPSVLSPLSWANVGVASGARPLRIGSFRQSTLGGIEIADPCTEAVGIVTDVLDQMGHHVDGSFPEAYDDPAYLDHFIDTLAPGVAGLIDYLTMAAGRPILKEDIEPSSWYWYDRGLGRSAGQLTEDLTWLQSFQRRMATWWSDGYYLLICPSFMSTAPLIGKLEEGGDATRRNIDLVRATAPFNSTGQPALTVPVTRISGMPVGVQLVAAFGREDLLLEVGLQLQEAIGWEMWRPREVSL